ncbi:hypothetical protein ACLKA6_001989 [Drosophila palustris]
MINLSGLLEGGVRYTRDATSDALLDAVQDFSLKNTFIGIVMLVCSYISVTCFNYAAHSQIMSVRSKFFKSVLRQDMSWYDFNQSGEVASRMNEDLSKMEDGLGEKVVIFVHFIVAFIGSIVQAFVKGWQLSLVCLTSLPVTFIVMGFVAVATSKQRMNLNEPLTTIEFRYVEFQYPTRKEVPILNLKIDRGKSTCIQLIQRYYDPQASDLYFNGTNIKDININWLYTYILYRATGQRIGSIIQSIATIILGVALTMYYE